MKLKHLPFLLGRKVSPQTYGHESVTVDLSKDGRVQFAHWLHPQNRRKLISQEIVDELRTFLSPGDVAIDIGAHSGDSTLPMALAAGPTGCVLAFEPNPYVFPILQANAALNPEKTRIVPRMVAATAKDGEIEFEYSDSGFCNGGRHEGVSRLLHGHVFSLSVQGRNLVSLVEREYPELLPRVRYLKVDAEGYDLTVLQSLEKLITSARPFINVEVFKWTSRENRVALFRFLTDRGFAIHRVLDESHYRGEILEEADVMRWRHFDVFCVPESHL